MDETTEILDWIDDHFSAAAKPLRLMGVLLDLQERFGYLPKPALREVARRMGLSPANVFGVATFYNQFRFVPPGKHPIKVCLGTACHIKQGVKILEHWERQLAIKVGGVTEDREYSLDRVACVGCCTLAPVVLMGEEVMGGMSPTRVDGILLQHKIKKEQQARAEQAAAAELQTAAEIQPEVET